MSSEKMPPGWEAEEMKIPSNKLDQTRAMLSTGKWYVRILGTGDCSVFRDGERVYDSTTSVESDRVADLETLRRTRENLLAENGELRRQLHIANAGNATLTEQLEKLQTDQDDENLR